MAGVRDEGPPAPWHRDGFLVVEGPVGAAAYPSDNRLQRRPTLAVRGFGAPR